MEKFPREKEDEAFGGFSGHLVRCCHHVLGLSVDGVSLMLREQLSFHGRGFGPREGPRAWPCS